MSYWRVESQINSAIQRNLGRITRYVLKKFQCKKCEGTGKEPQEKEDPYRETDEDCRFCKGTGWAKPKDILEGV